MARRIATTPGRRHARAVLAIFLAALTLILTACQDDDLARHTVARAVRGRLRRIAMDGRKGHRSDSRGLAMIGTFCGGGAALPEGERVLYNEVSEAPQRHMPAMFDIGDSVQHHSPATHAANLWPSLLFRLEQGRTPIRRKGSVDLKETHTCDATVSAASPDRLTLMWDGATLDRLRSDCMAAADVVSESFHERRITEDAAVGAAMCALSALCPGNTITRVGQIGTKADFYMNGSSVEMIEIKGVASHQTTLDSAFRTGKSQILAGGAALAWVCAVHFGSRELRLERVK